MKKSLDIISKNNNNNENEDNELSDQQQFGKLALWPDEWHRALWLLYSNKVWKNYSNY